MIIDVTELRSLRQERAWDVPEMARQLRLAARGAAIPSQQSLVRMIRRWEADGNGMSERYQLLYQRALGLSDPQAFPAASPAAPADVHLPGHDAEESDVDRREFLSASLVTAGVLSAPPQLAYLASGRRIGANVPEVLTRRLARLRKLDNYLGGSETYQLYAAELEATKTLAREAACPGQTRRALMAVISEQAQQTGWAAFDAGWQQTARGLYRESRDAARVAGDRGLEGNALALLAYQNLTTGQPAAALGQASCDAARSGTAPRVRVLLHERHAWAIASNGGSEREVRQALGRATAALQEPGGQHSPDWAAWADATEVQIMTGRCLTRIGRPREAIPVLQKALSGFDDAQARDKALYMSWLAEAHLDAGDIDSAAATASHALSLAVGVASVRPAQRLQAVISRLSAYRTAAVTDLLGRADPATAGPWPG